jgi:hypothetical protein
LAGSTLLLLLLRGWGSGTGLLRRSRSKRCAGRLRQRCAGERQTDRCQGADASGGADEGTKHIDAGNIMYLTLSRQKTACEKAACCGCDCARHTLAHQHPTTPCHTFPPCRMCTDFQFELCDVGEYLGVHSGRPHISFRGHKKISEPIYSGVSGILSLHHNTPWRRDY